MSNEGRTRAPGDRELGPTKAGEASGSLTDRFGGPEGLRRLVAQRRLQRKKAAEGAAPAESASLHAAADAGTSGAAGPLPFADTIQQSFGRHDVSGVQAHQGGEARRANQAMGAEAYASGNQVAFAGTPNLHTAAHEAAHVVQQRGGVALADGVGAEGDAHERQADAVADRVVQGRSAEALLGPPAPSPSPASTGVQMRKVRSDGGYKPYLTMDPARLADLVRRGDIDKDDYENIEALKASKPMPHELEAGAVDLGPVAPAKSAAPAGGGDELALLGGTHAGRRDAEKLAASDEEEDEEFASGVRKDGRLHDEDEPQGAGVPTQPKKKGGIKLFFSSAAKSASASIKGVFSKKPSAYRAQKDYQQPKMGGDEDRADRNEGHRGDEENALQKFLGRGGRPHKQVELEAYIDDALPALSLYRHSVQMVEEMQAGPARPEEHEEDGPAAPPPARAAPPAALSVPPSALSAAPAGMGGMAGMGGSPFSLSDGGAAEADWDPFTASGPPPFASASAARPPAAGHDPHFADDFDPFGPAASARPLAAGHDPHFADDFNPFAPAAVQAPSAAAKAKKAEKADKSKATAAKVGRAVDEDGDKAVDHLRHEQHGADVLPVAAAGDAVGVGGDLLSAKAARSRYERGGKAAADRDLSLDERAAGLGDQSKAKKAGATAGMGFVSHAGHAASAASHVPVVGEVIAPVGLASAAVKHTALAQQRSQLHEISATLGHEIDVLVALLMAARSSGERAPQLAERIQSVMVLAALHDKALAGLKANRAATAFQGVKTASSGAKVAMVALLATATLASGGIAAGVIGGVAAGAGLGAAAHSKHAKAKQKKGEDRAHGGLSQTLDEGDASSPHEVLGDANERAFEIMQRDPQVLADGILYLAVEKHDRAMEEPLRLLGLTMAELTELQAHGDNAGMLEFRTKLVDAVRSLTEGNR